MQIEMHEAMFEIQDDKGNYRFRKNTLIFENIADGFKSIQCHNLSLYLDVDLEITLTGPFKKTVDGLEFSFKV